MYSTVPYGTVQVLYSTGRYYDREKYVTSLLVVQHVQDHLTSAHDVS